MMFRFSSFGIFILMMPGHVRLKYTFCYRQTKTIICWQQYRSIAQVENERTRILCPTASRHSWEEKTAAACARPAHPGSGGYAWRAPRWHWWSPCSPRSSSSWGCAWYSSRGRRSSSTSLRATCSCRGTVPPPTATVSDSTWRRTTPARPCSSARATSPSSSTTRRRR